MSAIIKNILVTGGAGFIGSHLVEKLLKQNYRVTVLDNFSTGKLSNLNNVRNNKSLTIIKADIRDHYSDKLNAITKKYGTYQQIVHLAAQTSVAESIKYPKKDEEINYTSTLRLLLYAKNNSVRNFVFASSAAVYGDNESPLSSESLICKPLSPYGANKFSSELIQGFFARQYNISITPLRFFNVYGERQDPNSSYSGVISIFLDKALNNKDITIFGDGLQTRDFIYVQDIVSGICKAMFYTNNKAQPFNLGTGKSMSIIELAEEVIKSCNSTSKIFFKPARIGDLKYSTACTKASKLKLNFEAQNSIKNGLKNTVLWLKQQKINEEQMRLYESLA